MATESFIAKLGIDLSAFRRGIDAAKRHASGLKADIANQTGSALTGAVGGAFGVAALGAAAKSVADYADTIKSLGENLGVSTDFVQAFQHGIATSGGSAEGAQASLQKFSDLVGEAASGSFDAQGKLGQFGLSIVDSAGNLKTTEQLILEASDALKSIESPAERSAAAMDLFGKSGPAALSFLAQGAEGMRQFVAQADKLSTESIQALAGAKSTIEGFFKSITIAIGTAIGAVGKFFRIIGAFSVTGSISEAIKSVNQSDAASADAAKPKGISAGEKVFAELRDKIGKEREAQRKKELEAERKLGEEIKKNLERIIEFGEKKKAAQLGLQESTRNLALSRSDRSRFTLEELATSQIRFSGRLGAEQQQAQRAFQLERFAEINRLRGFGDLSISQLNTADEIRKGLTNLRDSERFPFRDLTERVEASNAELQKLNNLAQTEGVLIRPTNGE